MAMRKAGSRNFGDDQCMAPGEVAEYLRVSLSTVWRLVETGRRTRGRDGIYPVHKISHKVVRIRKSAVDRFLRSREVTAP